MIKSIPIRRTLPYAAVCDPVQTSRNSQIAINNGNQITILDPRLPTIHKSIIDPNAAILSQSDGDVLKKDFVLDPTDLYDISTVLRSEELDLIGIRSLSNLTVETVDQVYHISRIVEPHVRAHKWAPVNPQTKDCQLAVLLNTYELIIFERDTVDPSNYKPVHKIFNYLLDQLLLPRDKIAPDGNIKVTNDQYLSLMVESFELSQIDFGSGETLPLLSVATGNKQVSIYHIGKRLTKLIDIGHQEDIIVKQAWFGWEKHELFFTSCLVLVSANNRVSLLKLQYDIGQSKISVEQELEMIPHNSRFPVYQVSLTKLSGIEHLIIVSSNEARIYELNANNFKIIFQTSLRYRSVASGLLTFVENNELTVDIAFENGKFERFTLRLDNSEYLATPQPIAKKLQALINREIYLHELISSKGGDGEDAAPPSSSEAGLSQKTYLNDRVDFKFCNSGIKVLESSGMAVIVSRIIPQNVFNYVILSKNQFSVSFIPMKDIYPNFESATVKHVDSTTINHINAFWFQNYKRFPPTPVIHGSIPKPVERIDEFITKLNQLKAEYFGSVEEVKGSADSEVKQEINKEKIGHHSTFKQFIHDCFTANFQVIKFQRLYNFNIVMLKSLFFLSIKQSKHVKLQKSIEELKLEQLEIEKQIINQLIILVINYITKTMGSNVDILTSIDKYVIISYYLHLKSQGVATEELVSHLPSSAYVLVSTKFFDEVFDVSLDQIVADDEDILHVANSNTNHKWSRCALSLFPLLEMNNKVDELRKFNYVIYDEKTKIQNADELASVQSKYGEEFGGTSIIHNLLTSIDYCVYTGNKTYNVK